MDISITIPKEELKRLHSRFNKFDKNVKKLVNKEVTRAARAIEKRAKNDSPVNTGRLRASIHSIDNKKGSATVSTNVIYAEDVEKGIVKTKNGKQPFFSPNAKWERLKFLANINRIIRKEGK